MQTWEKSQTSNLWKRQPSGVFYIRCKIGGKLFSQSLKTKDLAYARRILPTIHKRLKALAERERETGADKLTTFDDAMEVLKARVLAMRSLKPNSKKYRLETFLQLYKVAPWLRSMRIKAITESDCQRVSNALADHYSSTRYNNALDSLKMIFGLAIERHVVNVNPAKALSRQKVVTKDKQLPSKEELQDVLGYVRDSNGGRARYNWELLSFLSYSGCRISEANNVTNGDVDRDAGTISVQGDPVTGTKNRIRRTIPIIPAMAALLDSMELGLIHKFKYEPKCL